MKDSKQVRKARHVCKQMRCPLPYSYLAVWARTKRVRVHIGQKRITYYRWPE